MMSFNEENIPDQTVRDMLSYCAITGILTWNTRGIEHFQQSASQASWNKRYAGKTAGSLRKSGYIVLAIFKNRVSAHRVCWFLHYGKWPAGNIDHINGDRADNRIVNLRDVSVADNNRNKTLQRNNKSGFNGVSWDAKVKKWRAQIGVCGARPKHIGFFESPDLAAAARRAAQESEGYAIGHGKPMHQTLASRIYSGVAHD